MKENGGTRLTMFNEIWISTLSLESRRGKQEFPFFEVSFNRFHSKTLKPKITAIFLCQPLCGNFHKTGKNKKRKKQQQKKKQQKKTEQD